MVTLVLNRSRITISEFNLASSKSVAYSTTNGNETEDMQLISEPSTHLQPGVFRSRPLLFVCLALLSAVIVCFPSWPGYMSFDTLFAFRESIDGIITSVWPPLHAYLFFLSRKVGLGPGGLFFVQVFGLFLFAFLIISMASKETWQAIGGAALFIGVLIYVPVLIGVAIVSWKDVTTTSFVLLGIATWLLAIKFQAMGFLVVSIVAFSGALGLRYNSLPLVVGIFICMVASPFLGKSKRSDRLYALIAVLLGITTAYASTVWRLPDFARLPGGSGFAGVQEFDLIGIEACSRRKYLPLAMSKGVPISPEQVAELYDPRHVQLSFRIVPGIPQLIETDGDGAVAEKWAEALRAEPRCYLSHRIEVFRWLMGLNESGVFYPTHGGIDPNPYGITLANPRSSQWITSYVINNANGPFRRPYILYILGSVAFFYTFYNRTLPRPVLIGIFAGLLAYPSALFIAAPAADARYIFPSNVLCVLFIVIAVVKISESFRHSHRAFRRRLFGRWPKA